MRGARGLRVLVDCRRGRCIPEPAAPIRGGSLSVVRVYSPHDSGYLSQSCVLTDGEAASLPLVGGPVSPQAGPAVPGLVAAPHFPAVSSKATSSSFVLVAANRTHTQTCVLKIQYIKGHAKQYNWDIEWLPLGIEPIESSSRRAAWVPLSAVQHCASSCSNGECRVCVDAYAMATSSIAGRPRASPSSVSSIPCHVHPAAYIGPLPGRSRMRGLIFSYVVAITCDRMLLR